MRSKLTIVSFSKMEGEFFVKDNQLPYEIMAI